MSTSCACGYCRSQVDFGEGLVEDGIWYHERCYYTMLKKKVEKLEKKYNRGTITLEEANDLREMAPLLLNVRKEMRRPSVSLKQIMSKDSGPVFQGKSEGLRMIEAHKRERSEYLALERARDNKKQLSRGSAIQDIPALKEALEC